MAGKARYAAVWALYGLVLLLVAEASLRTFFHLRYDSAFFASPKAVFLHIAYPELVVAGGYEYAPGKLNVLILGGSVLEPVRRIPDYLAADYDERGEKPIQILNAAWPGQSSLDSWYKYDLLRDEKFDVVIFYHGINEVRANYVRPELWRPDYNHYSWYNNVNYFFRGRDLRDDWSLLPFGWRYLKAAFVSKMFPERFVPVEQPSPDLYEFGAQIRSREEFSRNLTRIADLAATKGEKVVVLPFVFFDEEKAGLSAEEWPAVGMTVMWGKPEYVKRGIRVHNEAGMSVAEAKHLVYFDIAARIPERKELFQDICHFTPEGGKLFASELSQFLVSSGF
jgi:hypothetical protein